MSEPSSSAPFVLTLVVDLVRHLHRLSQVEEGAAFIMVTFHDTSEELLRAARAAGADHYQASDEEQGTEWEVASVQVERSWVSFYGRSRPLAEERKP